MWFDLVSMGVLALSWVIIGDFNIIRKDGERKGGHPRLPCAMSDFSNFIDAGGLIEVPFFGNNLLWCNGQNGLARTWAGLGWIELFVIPSGWNYFLRVPFNIWLVGHLITLLCFLVWLKVQRDMVLVLSCSSKCGLHMMISGG